MSDTKDQTNVMIGYLLQVMYERGEMLRKETTGSKEAERHASIIISLSRSISILREPYEYLNRPPDQEPQPEQPQAEPAEYDQERTALRQAQGPDTETEPEEEPTE